MKKNTIYLMLIPLVLGIVILSMILPQRCQEAPSIPNLPEEKIEEYKAFLLKDGKAPAEFIAAAFTDHDFVFVGEYYSTVQLSGFSRNVSVVKESIPPAYENGVRAIGLGCVLSTDQEKLDAFFAASEYQENLVREFFLNDFSVIGYTEYLGLLKDIWTFNSTLAPEAEKIHVVALGMELDHSDIKKMEDYEDPVKMNKALRGIVPEQFVLDLIEEKIVSQDTKALILLPMEYCVKDFVIKRQAEYYKQIGLTYTGSPAYLLNQKPGAHVFVVFLHNLWIKDNNQEYGLPIEGHIDATLRTWASALLKTAFGTKNSPFDEVQFIGVFSAQDDSTVTISRICDAYVINGLLADYTIPAIPSNTVSLENFAAIKDNFGLTENTDEKFTPQFFMDSINNSISATNEMMSKLQR